VIKQFSSRFPQDNVDASLMIMSLNGLNIRRAIFVAARKVTVWNHPSASST